VNKIPNVAAVSLSEAGHPIHATITLVRSFSSAAISTWASQNLAPWSTALSEALTYFRSVTAAGFRHDANVTGGKHPNDFP